jgi:hypothetical protein
LNDSVAFGDAADVLIVLRGFNGCAIVPTSSCAASRGNGIGVERDHVANELEPAGVTDDGGERILGDAAEELVELRELAAFSLPPHPHLLLRIPQARAMEKEEHILGGVSVLRVQRLDA